MPVMKKCDCQVTEEWRFQNDTAVTKRMHSHVLYKVEVKRKASRKKITQIIITWLCKCINCCYRLCIQMRQWNQFSLSTQQKHKLSTSEIVKENEDLFYTTLGLSLRCKQYYVPSIEQRTRLSRLRMKLRMRPRSFISGNICFEFSIHCSGLIEQGFFKASI